MHASPNYTPRPSSRWPRRLALAGLVALAVAAIGWAWQTWRERWMPDAARWPTQGVAVSATSAPIGWASLARQGARFAYLDATRGNTTAMRGFAAEHDAAIAAGLRVGAIHHFDICAAANGQAAAFVRLVPRERDALPPAVMLDDSPACVRRPTRALLLTELTTFLTQVETHMGKVAVVAPSAEMERDYGIANAVNRPLWLRSNRAEPDPDAGQWTIWQANDALVVPGATGRARWLVANDGAGMTAMGDTDDAR